MGTHYSRSGLGSHIDLQSLGARLVIYGDINDDKMPYFNPSIAFHEGKLKIAIRKCNFTTLRHKNWVFLDGNIYSKSEVLYGDLDPDTLDVSNLLPLSLDDDAPLETQIAGLEDVRLFSRRDGMHVIGFEVDRITPCYYKNSCMAEYRIDGDSLVYLRTLSKPISDRVEKNWQPSDEPNKRFDFTYSPTEVWKNGEVLGDVYKGEVHGGSQLIEQRNGTYLSIVHQKLADRRYGNVYDKYVYLSYLARHDKNGIITHLTKPFTFGTHENIEFASGMVEHDDNLIISLGIRDAKFGIARVAKSRLVDLLEPVA